MRVIGHTDFGGPEVLHEHDVPEPNLGAAEVRVRVTAAAVNPTDGIRRSGLRAELLRQEQRPWVPGMDFAGILEEIGDEVDSDLQVGDQVMGVISPKGPSGAYSEKVVVSPRSIVRAPAGFSDLQAATLPMTGLTAVQSLDCLGLRSGSVLGVTGAAGIYGGYVVQLAKHFGLQVIADASPEDTEMVRQLGADLVVPRGDDVSERFREAYPEGLDGLADGALLNEKVMDAVKPGGGMVTLRHFRDPSRGDIKFHPVHIKHYLFEQSKLDMIRVLAEKGVLTPRLASSVDATEAAKAHETMDLGGVRGRLVLSFGEGWGRKSPVV